MLKATEILSKPIINITKGNTVGTAKSLNFNQALSRLEQIIIFNDNDEPDELSLKPQSIYTIGKDALIIKDDNDVRPLIFEQLNAHNPINCKAYNLEGEFLGIVLDIELNANYTAENIVLDKESYSIKLVSALSDDTVLINTSGKKIARRRISFPRIKKEKAVKDKAEKVKILPIETDAPKITDPSQEISEAPAKPAEHKKAFVIASNPTPDRVLVNHSFLIGRKATRTIYGINNEIIVKKDSLLTDKILQTAIMHSKLNEVAIHSAQRKSSKL